MAESFTISLSQLSALAGIVSMVVVVTTAAARILTSWILSKMPKLPVEEKPGIQSIQCGMDHTAMRKSLEAQLSIYENLIEQQKLLMSLFKEMGHTHEIRHILLTNSLQEIKRVIEAGHAESNRRNEDLEKNLEAGHKIIMEKIEDLEQ